MSSSQPHIYKEHLQKFGETVSVKGVSRIIKSKGKLLRALWLVAVIASLCILLWQLSTVFMKYFKWPVDTVISESADPPPPFPDVTFCNTYPVKTFKQFAAKMSWTDFRVHSAEQINKLISSGNVESGKNLTVDEIDNLAMYFVSRSAYISNFPMFDDNLDMKNDLILDQVFYSWHWSELGSKCKNASIQLRWDPYYSSCTTLQLPKECQRQIRGVALILYIENFPELVQLVYTTGLVASQATGVTFVIHAPGTEPDERTSHSIGPGTETGISLSPINRSRLPSPYGDCTSQKYIENSDDDDDDERLLYTKDLCFDICFQQHIVDACGCLSTSFPFTLGQKLETDATVCGNLSMLENVSYSKIMHGFRDYLCSTQTTLDFDACDNICKDQCEELKYDMTVTTAPWPHISDELSFALSFGNNSIFKSRAEFEIYPKIIKQFLTSGNDTETLRMLESVDLIRRNFLQVNIFFDSHDSLILKDVPSLTADRMMGLIGGSLSLWLGVTIMTLVEVAEFFYTLIDMYFSKNKDSTRNQPKKMAVHAIG